MPPSDSAPSRQDPAQELSQLRRNMVQQLAASGKLTRAVFDIDRDYFGARFQTKAQESPAGPFRDLEVATTVVETLGEELQGAAAFADSPVLRDHIANMIAGIEELRAMLIQMEASSLGSVGLPSDKVSLKARVYPETNPLACLAEATGFVRESHAWVLRTVERIKGLGLMLEEAERARADAESSVHQISSDEITATLSAEIEARDKELRDLRQRATDLQDQVSGLSRAGSLSEGGLREEIDRLRGELDAAADQVTSDQAEVRSLVVEIERLAADCEQEARPDARDEVDDLVICVQVLRDAIQDRGTPIATLTTAADAVLREWFAWMHRREELNLEELAQTRAFVAKHEKAQVLADQAQQANAAQATANAAAQRLTGELEQFKAKHATAETERAALAKQVQTLTSQQAEAAQKATAQAATAQAEQQRLAEAAKAALARSVALDGELAQSKAQIERLTKAEIDARQAADKAGASGGSTAAAAQAQQAQLDKLRAELATAQQQKHAGEQQLAAANHKASAAQTEADRLRAQATQAKVELDAAQKLVAQSQTELATTKKSIETTQAEARSAQEQAQRKTTEATSEVTRLTTQVGELQQAAKQARTEIERLGKELASSAGLGADQDRLRKELDQQKQQRERLEQELLQARQQRDKAVTDLGAARDHAAAAAGRIDAVAEEHINLIEQRDGLQQQLEAMRSSARQAGEQAAKAAAALDQELAQVRGKIAEQEQLKTAAMKERDEARTRLDEMRRSTESLSSQSAQKQDSLAKELQSLRDAESAARAKVATAEGKIAQQDSRIQSLERDLAQAKSTLSARQVDVDRLGKDIAALQQTVREREVAVTRATDEGRVASAKFGREVEQLQGKLAGYETRDKQAAQEREANLRHRSESDRDRQQLDEKIRLAQGKAKDLQVEIDSTKLVATAAASERDKLRREVERLQGDQSQVAKKLEERDSQLTARLTETSRQLAELKQVAARLESERDRARAERERLEAERKRTAESRAREGTSVWAKRLADSAADLEETKVRASGLERKLGETSSRETEFSQRLAKAEETARTAQARVSALERGKAAGTAGTGTGTVAVGDASTRIAEMKDAVLAARALVVQSKAWQEQAAAKIAALSEQVRKLGGTPKV